MPGRNEVSAACRGAAGLRGALSCAALLCLLCAGCSDSSTPAADSAAADGARDAAADRSAPAPDGAADAADASGDDAALPTTCAGSCRTQTLAAQFAAVNAPFERAVYGLEAGATPTLYIEALHGGFSGCPQQSSPTPDRTLVISGLPLPRAGAPLSSADGLTVSLLDFKGDLLGSKPLVKASAATVTFVAADVCAGCIGQPAPADPDGFVALQLDATFDGGSVSGRVFAVHCDSLDR